MAAAAGKSGTGKRLRRKYYTACLDLEGKTCVVVGGGKVAERKVLSALECGAKVSLISPRVTRRLAGLAAARRIKRMKRGFRAGDVARAAIVFAATDDRELNQRVARLARRAGSLVNAVDAPGESDFIVPASLRRGALSISISTDGVSPALAARIRRDLEKTYGKGYSELLGELGKARERVLADISSAAARRRVLLALAHPEIAKLFSRGRRREGSKRIAAVLLRAGICGDSKGSPRRKRG